MKNDTLIRKEGMEVLMKELGLVEAERFIMLIQKEPFDYTRWQENLFADKSLETIYEEAAALRARTESSKKTPTPARKPKAGKKSVGRRKNAKHPTRA